MRVVFLRSFTVVASSLVLSEQRCPCRCQGAQSHAADFSNGEVFSLQSLKPVLWLRYDL